MNREPAAKAVHPCRTIRRASIAGFALTAIPRSRGFIHVKEGRCVHDFRNSRYLSSGCSSHLPTPKEKILKSMDWPLRPLLAAAVTWSFDREGQLAGICLKL